MKNSMGKDVAKKGRHPSNNDAFKIWKMKINGETIKMSSTCNIDSLFFSSALFIVIIAVSCRFRFIKKKWYHNNLHYFCNVNRKKTFHIFIDRMEFDCFFFFLHYHYYFNYMYELFVFCWCNYSTTFSRSLSLAFPRRSRWNICSMVIQMQCIAIDGAAWAAAVK